jgi:hypothetical protein
VEVVSRGGRRKGSEKGGPVAPNDGSADQPRTVQVRHNPAGMRGFGSACSPRLRRIARSSADALGARLGGHRRLK